MAKVRFKVSAEDMAKEATDKGDFVTPKPGFYILTLAECNPGFSKDSDGNEDKKKPRLECVYTITGVGREEAEPKENYGNIWDYVTFSESTGWKRSQFLKAFGMADPHGTGEFDDDVDTDDLINRKVLVRLKHEKDRRDKSAAPRAKVASMFLYGTDPADIEEAGEVEYGGDEPEFGGSGGSDEPTGFTEDDLADMDLKELGTVYKEMTGNDPKDLIVKKGTKVDADATKAAVIGAVLAAQGGAEEEDDPFGDAEPF